MTLSENRYQVRSGYKIPTRILLKVRVWGLKKDLDSVKRSDNRFGLRLKRSQDGESVKEGRKTYDTPSSSTSQTRTDDVVKRLLFWLGGCSIGTHSQSQEIIKVNKKVLWLSGMLIPVKYIIKLRARSVSRLCTGPTYISTQYRHVV